VIIARNFHGCIRGLIPPRRKYGKKNLEAADTKAPRGDRASPWSLHPLVFPDDPFISTNFQNEKGGGP
jgi:hypothetical protein